MREEVVNFTSEGASLVGIYNRSASGSFASRPVVVFWNVGVSHRVGPQRQFVDLARRLARLNFNCFRFDIGGLGDSQAASTGCSRRSQEHADVEAALDTLRDRYGHDRFVLVGFCSSAGTAHSVALADPRVVGLIMIDGYGYSTPMHRVRHTLGRLLSPRNITSRARRITKAMLRTEADAPRYFSDFPPREQVEAEILTMAERGMRFLYIYSGGVQLFYNHAHQFWSMFPSLRRYTAKIAVRYFGAANHLFMYPSNRSILLDCLQNWILDQFSATEASPHRGQDRSLPPANAEDRGTAAWLSSVPDGR